MTDATQPSSRDHFRSLSVLIAVNAVDMLGFAMVMPILPFYAQRMGATPLEIGALISSYSIAPGGTLTLLGSTTFNSPAGLRPFDARLDPSGQYLYVVDAARRLGAGRALVEASLEFARSGRLRALWVEPRSNNSAAIEFYRALGFRLSGFNDRMYSNADDAPGKTTLFMYREL